MNWTLELREHDRFIARSSSHSAHQAITILLRRLPGDALEVSVHELSPTRPQAIMHGELHVPPQRHHNPERVQRLRKGLEVRASGEIWRGTGTELRKLQQILQLIDDHEREEQSSAIWQLCRKLDPRHRVALVQWLRQESSASIARQARVDPRMARDCVRRSISMLMEHWQDPTPPRALLTTKPHPERGRPSLKNQLRAHLAQQQDETSFRQTLHTLLRRSPSGAELKALRDWSIGRNMAEVAARQGKGHSWISNLITRMGQRLKEQGTPQNRPQNTEAPDTEQGEPCGRETEA